MNSLTELVFTAGLASLLVFLVLILPLLYLLSGSLRPWFEQMATARALDPGMMVVKDAPPARRTASSRRPARKLTVSPTRTASAKPKAKPKASAKPAKKKTAKKKAPAKKKTAAKKKATAAKRKAPKKKATAKKKAAAKPKAVAKRPAAKPAARAGAKTVVKAKAVAKPKAASSKATQAGAKRDAKLGLIYSRKPKQVDDLKKISGVAKVLEGKLHGAGIYTYQQIADWKPVQVEAFGELLSFKGRIQRDDWKKQARALMKKSAAAKK